MKWQTVHEGIIWRVQQGVHDSGKVFEKAVRSPGSRLIVIKDNQVLLSREKRRELDGKIDYRLPGGKVFDTNSEFVSFLDSNGDMLNASRTSIAREGLEEVGLVIEPESLVHLGTDVLGATCEWDLYFWACSEFTEYEHGAQHHGTEADEIDGSVWVSFSEAIALALDSSQFSEGRSARMLMGYLNNIQSVKS
jgi:8-oxo-dGTP pyrophosphatase MutT (NUDIX family)